MWYVQSGTEAPLSYFSLWLSPLGLNVVVPTPPSRKGMTTASEPELFKYPPLDTLSSASLCPDKNSVPEQEENAYTEWVTHSVCQCGQWDHAVGVPLRSARKMEDTVVLSVQSYKPLWDGI